MTTKTLAYTLPLFSLLALGCPGPNPSENGDGGADLPAPALSTRAQKGLSVSPFVVSTAGLTAAQQEQLGVGSYLVNVVGGCTDCHDQTVAGSPPTVKYLAGGTKYPLPAMAGANTFVYARNLTSDPNVGMRLTEAQFIESMRTGRDFKSASTSELMYVMPWFASRWASEDDLKAMYAYLKIVPAVNNAVGADAKGLAAQVTPVMFPATYNEGDVSRPLPADPNPQDPLSAQRGLALQPLADPPELATLSAEQKNAYGRGSYLVTIGGCNDCHTNPARDLNPLSPTFMKLTTMAFLTGGATFTVPPALAPVLKQTRTMAANLIGANNGLKSRLSAAQFRELMIQNRHVASVGTAPLGWPMPPVYKNLVDEDFSAIYLYLTTVKGPSGSFDKVTQDYARYCTSTADCNVAAGETCDTTYSQCVGQTCTAASVATACNACQTCTASGNTKCAAPSPTSTCVSQGI